MGTRYPHAEAMDSLGIREDVELVFKNMGFETFMSMHVEGYQKKLASSYQHCSCTTMVRMKPRISTKVWDGSLSELEARNSLSPTVNWMSCMALRVKKIEQ